MNIINRKNKLFVINKEALQPKANKLDIHNALYAAIYDEFKGASENKTYNVLPSLELLKKVNEFAEKWLKDRGLN